MPHTLTLTVRLEHALMQASLRTIVCKFGHDPAICVEEKTFFCEIARHPPLSLHLGSPAPCATTV